MPKLGLILAVLAAASFCESRATNPSDAKGGPPRPVPVLAAVAVLRTVPITVQTFGTVEPGATVSLKPQVTGALLTVLFTEGRSINENDLLCTIDRQPFAAILAEAEARLKKNQVLAAQAKREADREEELAKKGTSTQLEAEKARADSDALAATLVVDEAAITRAKIDLAYCEIRAPIGGRVGRLLVDPGNIVRANETTIAVIHRLAPVFTSFAVPQDHLPAIRRGMEKGELVVEAVPTGEDTASAAGVLSFVDNEVDGSTGTIRLRARFTNEDGRLWPGQFVRIVLTLSGQEGAVVVPAAAVQTAQSGAFVYVIRDDLTVEDRPVVAGRTVAGETVIEKGLRELERVVTDGHLRLIPGAKVEVKGEDPPAGATSR
jgi:membrane fusion protein, multidrug efflux system